MATDTDTEQQQKIVEARHADKLGGWERQNKATSVQNHFKCVGLSRQAPETWYSLILVFAHVLYCI